MRGKFGEVRVVDTHGVRQLFINSQLQGSMFVEPDASEIDADLKGPLIPSSAYTYGWLIAGTQTPSASALMIGLGSGAGVIAFLANFPDTDMTVVEIDPVVVTMALKSFPALETYLNKGRLNIVIEDAKTFLSENDQLYDVAFADAYVGRGNKHVSSYHGLLRHRCKEAYFNIIDDPEHAVINETKELYHDLGMPLKWCTRAMPPQKLSTPVIGKSNWIVTTADVNWQKTDAFEPFEKLTGPQVDWARMCWNGVISSPTEL